MDKNTVMFQIAEHLSDLMQKKKQDTGLSYKEQAKQMGVSYQSLYKYLNATVECHGTNLVRIADYFDVSTDWLIGRSATSTTSTTIRN